MKKEEFVGEERPLYLGATPAKSLNHSSHKGVPFLSVQSLYAVELKLSLRIA